MINYTIRAIIKNTGQQLEKQVQCEDMKSALTEAEMFVYNELNLSFNDLSLFSVCGEAK
jgi:hypothetical protein